MTSVDEVAASLGGNKSEAEGLAGQLAASKQLAEELQGAIAAAGAEGTANRASAAVQTIEKLISEAAGLAERVGEAQAEVLAIGQSSLLATRTGTPATTAAPTRYARRLADFNPRRSHPEAVKEVRRVGYPQNAEGRTSARVFVYTADGKQLNGEPLKPYRKGEAPVRPELREPWASSPNFLIRRAAPRTSGTSYRAIRSHTSMSSARGECRTVRRSSGLERESRNDRLRPPRRSLPRHPCRAVATLRGRPRLTRPRGIRT